MEILLRALDVKDAIEGSYNLFASGHYDMFEYITYEEKRKMFNNDLKNVLETLPHFYDEEVHEIFIFLSILLISIIGISMIIRFSY